MQGFSQLSKMESHSISPENPAGSRGGGAKAVPSLSEGAARELGKGWKVQPCHSIEVGQTHTLADFKGEGVIRQIWLTLSGNWRMHVIRFYWDGETKPSVEVPLGDFFCSGWNKYSPLVSIPVCVNPGSAFNCYWEMPFRKGFRITVENSSLERSTIFYQINFEVGRIPENSCYFHAQFRRSNPLPYKEVHTVLDNVKGKGHYAGTYMAWGVNNNGWWGEGEIKFYMDGDAEYPTICGTGTEDYFCGSYNFENKEKREYERFTTPHAGLHQIIKPDGLYVSQQRFGLYRWHICDPVHFKEDLKVTIQALGWRSGGRFLPLQDDISSVAFWYQDTIFTDLPALPSKDKLEVI